MWGQSRKTLNYVDAVVDEIALEGLDGITLSGLWVRLANRKDFHLEATSEKARNFFWQIIKQQQCLEIFCIDEPRPPLVIFDRYEFIDPDLGMVIEPKEVPQDIYPFKLIDENGIKGSCTKYHTREDITQAARELSLDEAHGKWGECLVVVASQKVRATALLGKEYDPLLVQKITAIQWCMLERIGRARELGEVTQGTLSLQFMNENPKTLFYHRKALRKEGLIVKQIHYQKTKGQNFQGSLFHIPRFFVERKSKALMLVYSIIKYLKGTYRNMATYDEIREYLSMGTSVKKLFKTSEFQKYITGDMKVTYRTLHPNATEKGWKVKSSADREKSVRVIQLINPDVDPEVIWQDPKDDDGDDEDEDNNSGILDQSNWVIDRSMMHQAYGVLLEAGPGGISQQMLGKKMGLGKLDARTICRNLERRKLVTTFLNDFGRQRTTFFVAKPFEHLSPVSTQYQKEKKKMENLVKTKRKGGKKKPESAAVAQTKSEVTASSVDAPSNAPSADTAKPTDDIEIEISNHEQSGKDSNGSSSSYRQLRRANTIIELVRQHKVIDDPTKLYKAIQENEVKEGYDAKMDKKSLMRLLRRLAKEDQIKNIRVVLKLGDKRKNLHFVCEPNITETHTVIQSAIEQAKMKFTISPRQVPDHLSTKDPQFASASIDKSLEEMQTMGTVTPVKSPVYHTRFGRNYGLQPKFVRMRELHVLLFYLNYAYDGDPDLDQEKAIEGLDPSGINMTPEVRSELAKMKLYQGSIGWKMFIPPLPQHDGWDNGWCLMCDVLLRLPLSILVKIVNITLKIDGLQEYLNHPIRCNYLVRSLPHELKNKILYQRKYIFSTHEVATRLCYIGVLQFGPQKLKEKDQVFIFVNRKASLYDTMTSRPGYHQVEEKEYPKRAYNFETIGDVEKYWFEMKQICIMTSLGGPSSVSGQEITLETMDRKPAMIKALHPRRSEEAVAYDQGEIPGDRLGAAGLDSSMFGHLKRNWTWNIQSNANRRANEAEVKPVRVKKEGVKVTMEPNLKRTQKGQKRKRDAQQDGALKKPKPELPLTLTRAKPSVVKRFVRPKRQSVERKPFYDDKDRAALRLMRKLRVDWTPGEDSFLLLCKVAGSYLCRNLRYQMVQYTQVRDLLHKHFPESQNKTSRACQRRINYMLKNKATVDNVTLFLADIQQDPSILSRFVVPTASVGKLDNEARIHRDFEPLVDILMKKFRNADDVDAMDLPLDIKELNERYEIVFPAASITEKPGYVEPTSPVDVKAGVINALIISSLCSASDKTSWAFQLFKIYQQYPDSLLRSVMTKVRNDKMVSLKKHYNKTKVKMGNYLPLSSSPYQLSVTFSHTFLSRYQYDIYHQAWLLLKQLLHNALTSETGHEVVVGQEGGFTASIVGLMAKGRLAFRTEVPEQLVVLDPNLSLVDDQYVRVLKRFKELLKNSGTFDRDEIDAMEAKARSRKELTVSALFKKSDSQPMDVEQGEPSKRSEVVRMDRSNEVVFKDNDERSNTQVAKSASRIALYMMREEMRDSPINVIQHSHDFFVISSCKIFARVVGDDQDAMTQVGKMVVPKSFLPADPDKIEGVLNRYGCDKNGMSNQGIIRKRKTCLPLALPDLKEFVEELKRKGRPEKEIDELVAVYEFIFAGELIGVVGPDLKVFAQERGIDAIIDRTRELCDGHLVLRTGIKHMRYIAAKFSDPWLLHSFRMLRTKDKEKADNVKYAGKLMSSEDLTMNNEISEAVNKINWEKVEQISVVLRPWLRVDGSLNRRVLDRLLGAVLGRVMQSPGQSVAVVSAKFSPALQPAHCRELIEILTEIGCVEIARVVVSPCALFRPSAEIVVAEASDLDAEEELLVEPTVDAVIKLGQFIGDKSYGLDFVCQCPCHPDKRL